MLIPVGFASVSLELELSGFNRHAFVTFGVTAPSGDPAEVGLQVWTAAQASGSFMSKLDSNVMMFAVNVTCGTADGTGNSAQHAGGNFGGFATSAPPANVAVLIHKRTARGGRRGRGRLYLPWYVDEAMVGEAGTIGPTITGPINTALGVFRTTLASGPGPMVLLHSPSQPGVDVPTTPGPPDVVTSLLCDAQVGTQRRRLGRR